MSDSSEKDEIYNLTNQPQGNGIMDKTNNGTEIKISKNLPRSQRKRLIREQRRNTRKRMKKEGNNNIRVNKESRHSNNDDEDYVCKKDRQQQSKERCIQALEKGQRVCIDLSLEEHMNEKEHSKLAQQLCRLYGSNRRSMKPMHIYFSGLKKDGNLFKECIRKNNGFENYIVDIKEENHLELFPKEDIVYLSPDSENVLSEIDVNKVYIIGGLVDESITNNITHGKADHDQIQTARLPIDEYMTKTKGSFIKVLAVNQVFDILLEMHESGNWNKALSIGVPKRTGFVVKE